MTYNGVDTYIVGIGTVRECIDCSCLVPGGPTRCIRCAKDGPPGGSKKESSSPLWNVIDSEGHLHTVEAEYFGIEEDGSLVFYKGGETEPRYPVGVAAPYSWVFARRMG